ncbi:MAG: hypothetical protein M1338_02760, partial [Patescibacteria group bacterium]|nr:hypothetical protein [Patescibacteria group bacterium]
MKDDLVIHVRYKKILSVILIILASLSLLSFIFFNNLKSTVANPEFYKATLKKADVYSRLINDGIPAMITETKISDDLMTNVLAKDAIIFIIKKSIPPAWVEEQTNNLIDQIAQIFSKPQDSSNVSLKLEKLNGYLTQVNDGIIILEQIIPSCADSQNAGNLAKQLL